MGFLALCCHGAAILSLWRCVAVAAGCCCCRCSFAAVTGFLAFHGYPSHVLRCIVEACRFERDFRKRPMMPMPWPFPPSCFFLLLLLAAAAAAAFAAVSVMCSGHMHTEQASQLCLPKSWNMLKNWASYML